MSHPQRLMTLAVLMIALPHLSTASAQTVIYVDDDAPLGGDGTSWPTSYTYLQDALAAATGGDAIHVAQGVYRPDQDEAGNATPGDRLATFHLIGGVALLGGFRGCPVGDCSGDPGERNISTYETILSGDLYADDHVHSSNTGENSYHVVTGSGTDTTAVLDGFTITGGNANGRNWPHYDGAGMCNDQASPTVTNCIFSVNTASAYGGGMYNRSSSPTVANCTFSVNTVFYGGGGMANFDYSSPTVTDCTFNENTVDGGVGGGMFNFSYSNPAVTSCTFSGNSAANGGGGMVNFEYSSPTVANCTFSWNTAGYGGGGMNDSFYSNPTVINCTFSGNDAGTYGGGMYNYDYSSPTVTNCTFSGNTAVYGGGGMSDFGFSDPTVTNCSFGGNAAAYHGGGMYNSYSNPAVTNCKFSGNTTAYFGGGMYNYEYSSPTVTNCIFSVNTAGERGGGMNNEDYSDPTLTNCTFSGNTVDDGEGGGIHNHYSSPVVTNCTFSGNTAAYYGGGMYNRSSSPTVTNCIHWGNLPDEIYDYNSTTTVTYSAVGDDDPDDGIVYPGTGNIDDDPLFVDADGPDDTFGTEDDDIRLSAGSPCIDAGDNDGVPPDTPDLDGDSDTEEPLPLDVAGGPRFLDDLQTPDTGNGVPPIVDMGAYEFHPPIVIVAHLDIKPGSCPNPVNVRSRGVVPVAIVGSESFDVTEIDTDSLVLTRADGVGAAVTPIARRHGRIGSFEDVATPFDGEPCDCHDLSGDGLDDLVVKFSTQEMAKLLDLDSESRRAPVILTVSGSLLDVSEFEASDCVVIIAGRTPASSLRVTGKRGKR